MIADRLRYFLVAARREHLGQAAEELGISQPALSRSILRLEEEFGVQLFDRSGRSVRLNASGRLLLRRVERAFAELEDAQRDLADRAAEGGRAMVLGFLATMGARLIPELIRGFREEHPDAQFRLLQGPYPFLRDRLIAGEIDLCISAPSFAEADLEWQPLYEEELTVVVPAAHALAGKKEIDLIEIAKEPIIAMKSTYGLRQSLEELCREAGFQPQISFEAEEVSTLLGLVGAGFGVTLTPRPSESDLYKSLIVRTPTCKRTVGVSWRNGRYLPPLTGEFRAYLVDQFAKGGPV
jgi:DNA-binding transcriptional LysR family regulator